MPFGANIPLATNYESTWNFKKQTGTETFTSVFGGDYNLTYRRSVKRIAKGVYVIHYSYNGTYSDLSVAGSFAVPTLGWAVGNNPDYQAYQGSVKYDGRGAVTVEVDVMP